MKKLLLGIAIALVATGCTAESENPQTSWDNFINQEITWRSCGPDECARIIAPVDYDDLDGDVVEISVVRIGGDSKPLLFVNPGGPGGSGYDYATYLGTAAGQDLLDKFSLIGFDPRGVVRSSPVQCLPDDELNEFIKSDPMPNTKEELEQAALDYREMGLACEKNTGPLAAHVSTIEVVKDLDLMRQVLGQEKLNYFGASYGTEIGAFYAEMFGENVGTMVLDSPVDLEADALEQTLGQARGFQRAFDSFVDYCLVDGCVLGDSLSEARAEVTKLINSLADQPLKVDDGRTLSQSEGIYGLAAALYSDSSWGWLETGLGEAIESKDGTWLMTLADYYFEREGDRFLDNSFQVFNVVRCLDAVEVRSIDQQLADYPKFVEVSPVFGDFLAWDVACLEWPLESTIERPEVDGDKAPPILVVGTTNDPATPYEWAEAMTSQLKSAVLITKVGDGHGAYASGNACIDRAIEDALINGKMPRPNSKC